MSAPASAVIVGGGHNGLVCAAYLARAGWSVEIIEAADQVGGAAVTKEFAPGYRVSACAHLLHSLHPQVVADLQLARDGFAGADHPIDTVAVGADGASLRISRDATATARALEAFSPRDAQRYPLFDARMQRIARALHPFLTRTPPRLGTRNLSDLRTLAELGWSVRRLGQQQMREALRIGGMCMADLLEDEFETDLLRGALSFDAVLGAWLGPRSPNSVLTWLYRLVGELGGVAGRSGAHLLPGGMGALSDQLAAAAQRSGARIRTGTPVRRIVVENDRACGVELESGEIVPARTVISNADPRRTFLDLVGPQELDTGFVTRVRNLRARGTVAKLHLALDGLPEFPGLDRAAPGGRVLLAPGIDALERAWNHAKYGEYSAEPAMEITLPSIADPSLAPGGCHVLSAMVLYAPYELRAGWESGHSDFESLAIDRIATLAPGVRKHIVASELLTPLDIERDYRITGGHWHHAELGLDSVLMLRPIPGAAQYATPLPGLYLCGAGTHPGGGVSGACGLNAARTVIEREAA